MAKISIQVIGCGDAFGSGGMFNTCFFVKADDFNFLIDCGGTSLVGLKKAGLSSNDVDAIFISHFHGDHIAGIAFLLCEAKNYFNRKKDLHIIGPKGIQEKVEIITNTLYENTTQSLASKIHYHEIKQEEASSLQGVEYTYFPVVHSPSTSPHGIRFKIGEKIIGYSGDTEWTDVLYKISENADLFICECNNYEKKGKSHLNYQTLKEKRENIQCKKMILTHLGEEMLKNKNSLDIEVAEDGQKIII